MCNDSINPKDICKALDDVRSKIENDISTMQEVHALFDEQDRSYRDSAGNDDGNEDHFETYGEGDHVVGCDRGEELTRIEEFLRLTDRYYLHEANSLIRDIDRADTDEKLEMVQEAIEHLESQYDDSNSVVSEFEHYVR